MHACARARVDLPRPPSPPPPPPSSRNVVSRRLITGVQPLHQMVGAASQMGHIKDQVVRGPLFELFSRFLGELGVHEDDMLHDLVKLPVGKELKQVVEDHCLVPRASRVGRAGVHANSVTDSVTEVLTAMGTYEGVADHLLRHQQQVREDGGRTQVLLGFDGAVVVRSNRLLLTQTWVRVVTPGMSQDETWLQPVQMFNANDKQPQVWEHAGHVFEQKDIQGGFKFKLEHPGRSTEATDASGRVWPTTDPSTFHHSVDRISYCGDMFSVTCLLGMLPPVRHLYWNVVPFVAELVQGYSARHGPVHFASASRSREFFKLYFSTPQAEADMKARGWDPSCKGLYDTQFMGKNFGVDDNAIMVGNLHWHSLFKKQLSIVCEAAHAKKPACTKELEATLRARGVNLRLLHKDGRFVVSARQGEMAKAMRCNCPSEVFYMPSAGATFNLVVARHAALLKFMSMVLYSLDKDSAHLLRMYPAVAWTAQSSFGCFTASGVDNDVRAKYTPSFNNATSYTVATLYTMLQTGDMPGLYCDKINENMHPIVMWASKRLSRKKN